MIKSILMKDCATYSKDGCTINDCQKVNFFYGPNGSGKSTISNFLHNPDNPFYSSCNIEWEGPTKTDIIVYNRDFRIRHFKEDIDGVFTLGEATIDDITALEEMKSERQKKNDDYDTRSKSLENKMIEKAQCDATFRDNIWNAILKANEGDFQGVFSGLRGNKEKFKNEVVTRYKSHTTSNDTREILKNKYDSLYCSNLEKCNPIEMNIKDSISALQSIETNEIWQKAIVGKDDLPISKLISILHNDDWVNKGRSYVREDDVCPFCQQHTLTNNLKQQLNNFFSGEYDNNMKTVKSLSENYIRISTQLLSVLSGLIKNDDVVKIGKIDVAKYKDSIDLFEGVINSNNSLFSQKQNEPSRKISVNPSNIKIEEILKMINNANENISSHNAIVENVNSEKTSLIDSVWAYFLHEQDALISDYCKELSKIESAIRGIKDGIDVCKTQIETLNDRIYEAGKNITSVQPTVDEINRSLKAYGFTNFQIVPSKTKINSYQIQRMDGSLATKTLSEGEETFISFLYFLQYAKGSNDISKLSSKKILVIDDPICSLDSTVLYIVSSMVKALIKDVRAGKSDVEQVFILTHNVFFHKEASFIDGRATEYGDINFWIISKDNNITSIRSFSRNNPIKTSYELLWQELKTNSSASLITTQNVMRRILENYFSILGRKIDDTIVDSFDTSEDQMICRSLISWINDGSHSIPDDLYIDSYTDSIDRYKDIFKQIFIKMDHKAHYDMMMGEMGN